MARLPGLAQAIAEHDDRPATMISHFARVLRDAEVIDSKTTGLGAAQMDYDDATTLLLATLGALTPAGGPAAVAAARELQPLAWDDSSARISQSPLADVWGQPFAEMVKHCIMNADELQRWEQTYRTRLSEEGRRLIFPSGLLGAVVETRTFNISVYSNCVLARIWLGVPSPDPQLFAQQTFTPLGLPGTAVKSAAGLRSAGIDVLLALKLAVENPPPARTWKRKRP
ncbi:hypothetical protein [Brevundimonas sp. A19_0]|uniref:hypothetical protein n=1 Tax=Brevundimonas sp. A19_0 TaxID=2821087 RepID=UPI001AD9CF02|nr:hypothetical protein [Brevundimonas sp. A19_0]MBO9502195.1 hypothetical protein [Brevundimonas sp. A19_0]